MKVKENLEEELLENSYRAEEVIKYLNYGLEEIEENNVFEDVVEQIKDVIEIIEEYKAQFNSDLAEIANYNKQELNEMYENSVL